MKLVSRVALPLLFASTVLAAWMATPGAAQTPAAVQEGESPNVRITFQTLPPARAEVWSGKKRLGMIMDRRRPLIIGRPRDSGPLDVTIKAEGFLPVHTRAYTFDDYSVSVKLTPQGEKHTLFGYRAPVADAGAPSDASQ